MKMKNNIMRMIAAGAILGVVVTTLFAQDNQTLVSFSNLVSKTWTTLTAEDVTVTDDLQAASVVVTTDIVVGGGSNIKRILSTAESVDIGATATNAISTANVTLNGVGTNDTVALNVVSPHVNFVYSAVVSATNTITVRAANISITNNVNPSATDMRFTVFGY